MERCGLPLAVDPRDVPGRRAARARGEVYGDR